jgi:hypothetical protein
MCFTSRLFRFRYVITIFFLSLASSMLTGCGTSFAYKPKRDAVYTGIPSSKGVEVLKGADIRDKKDRKGVKWNKPVEQIVADALVDELKNSKLFSRVDLHSSNQTFAVSGTYSYRVTFAVKRLRLYNPPKVGEIAGGAALGLLGVPGIFIAASIPTKWESNAEVKFEVFDGETQSSVLKKSYTSELSLSANAYAGNSRQKQQTSDVLERVIGQFIADLATLPLSQKTATVTGSFN